MSIHQKTETFDSGQSIAQSGHYKIFHKAHHLRSDIGLLKGDLFPRMRELLDPCTFSTHTAVSGGICQGAVSPSEQQLRLTSRTLAAYAINSLTLQGCGNLARGRDGWPFPAISFLAPAHAQIARFYPWRWHWLNTGRA
jgi:hypothetical protein